MSPEGAALLAAVAPYAVEDRARTWRLLLSTLALQAGAMTCTALAPWPLRPLPEVMRAVPALQAPVKTSFAPADIAGVWRSHLWDAAAGRVVDFEGRPARPEGLTGPMG